MNNYVKILLFYSLIIALSACHSAKKAAKDNSEWQDIVIVDSADIVKNINTEYKYAALKTKYAGYLKIPPDSLKNIKLYQFIDKWMGTHYEWGGEDENGIDCSAFVQQLLTDVYDIDLPRTSVQQFLTNRVERFKGKQHLAEGDLIFFRTNSKKLISHVGFYLHNNIFINSSSSKGVSLANLDSPYWKSKYVAAGRIRSQYRVQSLK